MKTFTERVEKDGINVKEFAAVSGIPYNRIYKWSANGGKKDKNIVAATFKYLLENGIPEFQKRIIDIQDGAAITIQEEIAREKYSDQAPLNNGNRKPKAKKTAPKITDNNYKTTGKTLSEEKDTVVNSTPPITEGYSPKEDQNQKEEDMYKEAMELARINAETSRLNAETSLKNAETARILAVAHDKAIEAIREVVSLRKEREARELQKRTGT